MDDSTRPRADRVKPEERAAAARAPSPSSSSGASAASESAPELEGPQPDANVLVGATVADRYEIIERMGRGGMGVVYLANDHMLRREVALKVLRRGPETDARAIERFTREAKSAAAMNNPHVVSIIDFGQTDSGEPYLVMERLVGSDLRSLILAEGALAPERCARIAAQVLRGLRAAHARGIVHRDLKSDNIFLTTEHGQEHVKLIDFGISKLLEPLDGEGEASTLTATGAIVGTPHYISPEQAHGDASVDERSDLYSLGVVLYEMLTAKLPFAGASALELMMKHANQRPEPPSKKRPDLQIPPALERVVLRALQKSPARRFSSASVMLGALEATDLLPTTGRDGALRRATPPVPSRRGPLALGGLLVLVLIVAGALWLRRGVGPQPAMDAAVRAPRLDGRVQATETADRRRERPRDAAPARDAAPQRGDAADAAVARSAGTKIKLVVRAPAGAQVFIGRRRVGSGHVETHLPRGKHAVSVRVRATGYRPWQRSIVPDRNHTLPVQLVPAPGGDLERNPHRP